MTNANVNTTEKKRTKKDFFYMLANIEEVKNNNDLLWFCEHEIELLEKKENTPKKPTKRQAENSPLIEEIANILNNVKDDAMTIAELRKQSEKLEECTQQRISALLKKLVDAGRVERVKDKKGHTTYKAVQQEQEQE